MDRHQAQILFRMKRQKKRKLKKEGNAFFFSLEGQNKLVISDPGLDITEVISKQYKLMKKDRRNSFYCRKI